MELFYTPPYAYDVLRESFKQPGLETEVTNEWSCSTLPIRLYDAHRKSFKQPGLETEVTSEWSCASTPPYAFIACTERVSFSFLSLYISLSHSLTMYVCISRCFVTKCGRMC